VKKFDLDTVARITGLDPNDIYTATKWYATEGPAVCHEAPSTLVHNKNGFQNYRAITCLSALTGNFDRKGGSIPMDFSYIEQTAGFHTLDEEFYREKKPKNHKPPIGTEDFPLWHAMTEEYQSMGLAKQIVTKKPYPIKSLVSFGMNTRMFPNTDKLRYALTQLDFFVNVDLFMTEACKFADIVLPACSSFERGEYKTYMGGFATYTKPVIRPLYDSKSDADIICDLAQYLELDDPLLKAGYREWLRHITSPLSMSIEELEESELPVHMPEAKPFIPGNYTNTGFRTPSGKFEFKSKLIEPFEDSYGLSSIPTFPIEEALAESKYPFCLVTGARLPNAMHSRLHKVDWLKSMRPEPAADISMEDALELNIHEGDMIELFNDQGSIRVQAKPSYKIAKGQVFMYHGYEQANVSQLVSNEELDPYSGYASYKNSRCGIRRVEVE